MISISSHERQFILLSADMDAILPTVDNEQRSATSTIEEEKHRLTRRQTKTHTVYDYGYYLFCDDYR